MDTQALATAIQRELDRLEWSSDTAPEGTSCLDAFPTTDDGIIALEDTQETTYVHGIGVLQTLQTLECPITWDNLWQAILPHMGAEPSPPRAAPAAPPPQEHAMPTWLDQYPWLRDRMLDLNAQLLYTPDGLAPPSRRDRLWTWWRTYHPWLTVALAALYLVLIGQEMRARHHWEEAADAYIAQLHALNDDVADLRQRATHDILTRGMAIGILIADCHVTGTFASDAAWDAWLTELAATTPTTCEALRATLEDPQPH